MKKAWTIFVLLLLACATHAQQLKAGVVWSALQVTKTPLVKHLELDTGLQDNRYFKINQVRPIAKVQTDLPGLYLQYEWPKNFFVRTELRISLNKFEAGPFANNNPDTNFITSRWLMSRPMFTAEGGYFFGHRKTWNPFLSGGLSLSFFRFQQRYIGTYGYNDYDAVNYYNYFSTDPWFLSLHFRAGFQRRAFTFSTSFKTSITQVDRHDAFQKLTCWSVLEISWNFYRSAFFAKKQYEENTDVNSVRHTTRMDLKKSSSITGLRLPLYGFIMQQNYLDAWQNGSYNYVVDIHQAPVQRLNGEIFANHSHTVNKSKTLYVRNEYGINLMSFTYKSVRRITEALPTLPDVDDKNDLLVRTEDVTQRYLGVFYAFKGGLRVKTGKKSFVYAELGARCLVSLKRYKTATDVPLVKKSLSWINPELGAQFGHKGIQLGLLSTAGKPDDYHIYKNIYAIYIGIYHEIYAK